MTKSFSVLMFFSILCANTVADVPNLNEIEKNIVRHLRTYDGLEFSIESSLYQKDSQGKIKDSLSDVRETIRLHFPKQGPAWKYWVQEIQDKFDNLWIHNRFKVTNIIETRKFRYTPEGEGKWSKGAIVPWYQWDEEEGRYFFHFLGMNTIGVSLFAFVVSDDLLRKVSATQKLQFFNEGVCDGMKTFQFKGRDEEFGVQYEVHFTFPQCMVTYWEGKGIKETVSVIYNVEKIGHFEKIDYPQKGSFFATANRHQDDIDYKFNVTDVHRFDPALLNNWFPEWSASTIVSDVKTGDGIRIPPNERQLKKVAEAFVAEVESEKVESEKASRWLPFRIFLIIAGAVLIIISVYLSLRKQYNNKK
jgi:hypothetical protein